MMTRKSARAILLNQNNEILLTRFVQTKIIGDIAWWVFPGGGIKKDESPINACVREIFEETGLKLHSSSLQHVWNRKNILNGKKEDILSDEKYYLVNIKKFDITSNNFTKNEKETFIDYKWWSLEALKVSNDNLTISNTYELIQQILTENNTNFPIDISEN